MRILLLVFLGLVSMSGSAQGGFPYQIQGGTTWPVLGAGVLTTGASVYLDRRVQPLTPEQITTLMRSPVTGFDSYALPYYSERAHQVSNISGLASVAMPFALLLDRNNRRHADKLMLITFEGALLNMGVMSLTKALTLRPRPFVYNPDVPMDIKLENGAQYSFFSGHVSTAATFSFMGAQMYSDLYPNSRYKKVVWVVAAALPMVTGYARMRAGKHFPTDVIVGYGVGAAIGIFVPRLHRIKS
jgi:membrane-associated phospholipid phosphatase